MRKVLAGVTAFAAMLLLALPATASATPTTGTWYSYPAQTTSTETSTTTGPTAYKSAVRPPINADGSSNWPAKRGVIPVQFDLLAAPSTTTTTTTTYGPPVWESIQADGSYSFAGLTLSSDLTFSDITNLSADYEFTTGDCFGGSLRWTISVDHGGSVKLIHVYYGTPNNTLTPPFQSCSGLNSGSGDNLITTGMQLTLDSGWMADQRANVSNVTVNDNTWVPKTIETTTGATVMGAYAKTCALPAAELRWAKNDATPDGAINEAESIQPKDTGQFYRQVDCKYIYNLDVSSLNGQGTYTVWVRINGTNLPVPATFDLR